MANKTKTDRMLIWIKDNKYLSIIIILGLIIMSVGAVSESLSNIYNFIHGTTTNATYNKPKEIVQLNSAAHNAPKQGQSDDIQGTFAPTGWIGDGEYGRQYIDLAGAYQDDVHTPPDSIRIKYTFGPKQWAGMYWQNLPDNWGDKPGNDYSHRGLSKISFWAKGVTGKEVVEFKAGDINTAGKQYRDSFRASIGRVTLSTEWQHYAINIQAVDLSSVIGAFCWVASRQFNNADSITFLLDDIHFE